MIIIVDYGMGNVGSIRNMFKRVGALVTITSDRSTIEIASKLVLPGVGAFDNAMRNLEKLGIIPLLNTKALVEKVPVLGICLGAQLLTNCSEEGTLPGLGWINAKTVRFSFTSGQPSLKVPHMGWNNVRPSQPSPLFRDLEVGGRFYFVHSYHPACNNDKHVLATTTYGYEFASAIINGNIMGVQFHPEKSHKYGLQLLRNFVERM